MSVRSGDAAGCAVRAGDAAGALARRLDEDEQEAADAELRAIEPIRLHECRHTYASLMIAAGVNATALSSYMGHASITITLDRYGT